MTVTDSNFFLVKLVRFVTALAVNTSEYNHIFLNRELRFTGVGCFNVRLKYARTKLLPLVLYGRESVLD